MKKACQVLMLVMVFVAILVSPVYAASAERDGLKVEFTTDKQVYQKDEAIKTTLKVTNENDIAISNVMLKTQLPDGYQFAADSEKELKMVSLGAKESAEVTSEIEKTKNQDAEGGENDVQNPSQTKPEDTSGSNGLGTGDGAKLFVWTLAAGGAVLMAGTVCFYKKRSGKQFLSLLLILAMTASMFSGFALEAEAATVQRSIEVTETIKVDGKDVTLKATVTYDMKVSEDEITEVSRETWIANLAEALQLEGVEDGQHSFDDFAETVYADKIEAAVRRGWVELEADEDNMVYFEPDKAATREFAAYTVVHALGYFLQTEEIPEWSDAAALTYPAEALQAVNAEILSLRGNVFAPTEALTVSDMNHALTTIHAILDSTNVDGETVGEVAYTEGVKETELVYELDEENHTVTLTGNEAADWKVGEIHVLKAVDGAEKDIAIKIVELRKENGQTVIVYAEPELSEVVTSFEVVGQTSGEGVFIPAEGVVVENASPARAATAGEIPLFGKKNISLNIGDVSFSGAIDVKNLEYRFAASPAWHLISIDEVYVALNTSLELSASYTNDFDTDKKVKIGTFKAPIGYGFNGSGDIYLIFSASAGVEIGFEVTNKAGIQYAKNNGIRPVFDMDTEPTELALQGEVKGGMAAEVGAEFLGIDLVTVGAEAGVAFNGAIENMSVAPIEFCLDGTLYAFLGIYARIGWEDLNLKIDREIFNSDNSIWKRGMHFEECGKVDECTRGHGNYEGYVKRLDDGIVIHNAKIQILKDGRIKDTTYSDSHGYFRGIKVPAGDYEIRVSAAGYLPYEQSFQIVGGQTSALETQLMIDNEYKDEDKALTCSGMITNAYTGGAVEGAKISVYSKFLFGEGELVALVTTGADGTYEFQIPIGYYEMKIEKEGFAENYKSLAMIHDTRDVYISLSPENQEPMEGNLRAVLHWGLYPEDLDSHLVGPQGEGLFHVFYSDMYSNYADLDVDDTTSYGPETISISQTEPGIYSYYIHDFTNRESSASTALSNSGAYVELYADNTRMYTIHVPENKGGTVWHVFDYHSETGAIQLVNEFTYESDPEYVGWRGTSEQRIMNVSLEEKDTVKK